jgi:hypothetical protein
MLGILIAWKPTVGMIWIVTLMSGTYMYIYTWECNIPASDMWESLQDGAVYVKFAKHEDWERKSTSDP